MWLDRKFVLLRMLDVRNECWKFDVTEKGYYCRKPM